MAEERGSAAAGNPEPVAPVEPATPATAAAPAPAMPDPAAVAASTSEFLAGIGNEDLRGWAETKGITETEQALSSYRNLEKLFGADKADRTVALLGDEPTAEEFSAFHNKLGRPKEASGYSFDPAEGDAGDFARGAQAKFHELGISDTQAVGLNDWFNGASDQHAERSAEQVAETQAASEAVLKKEWGAAYDANIKGLDVTAAKLGISDDMLKGLHETVGGPEAAKFIHGLGLKIGEDTLIGDADNINGVMTPEQAKLKLSELTSSEEFMKAWMTKEHPGHAAAVEKKARFSRMAAGELP